ncbi:MAG: tetratricopeptide repeat protein [Flavobacteriales bacterium]|nr:tetratricopeptide repeat protein [Flavobacteriales bacterium]
MNDLANEYRISGNLDLAKLYADSALSVADKTGWSYGKAWSYNNLAYINLYESDFETAIKNAVSALQIAEENNDKKNLGFSYLYIGFVNLSLGENKDVLPYYYKSLKIRKELGDKYNLGFSYTYLGNYYETSDLDSCFYYHSQALSSRLKTGDSRSIADSYLLIGKVLFKQKLFDKAIENYNFALEKYQAINDIRRLAETYRIFAEIYIQQGKFEEAEIFLLRAMNLAQEVGAIENLIPLYNELAILEEKKGNYSEAYSYVRKHIDYKDSINNNKIYREITKHILKYKIEKEEKIKELYFQKEKEKQQLIALSASIGLVLVLAFLLFIFNRLKLTRKQKEAIDIQKHELEKTHDSLATHHKEIQDSINYAKRIQDAMLTSENHQRQQFPEHFILFKPKDVVSGDYYWSLEKEIPSSSVEGIEKYLYLTVVDCTGHGVPGAFMSMLGISFLNEITSHEKLLTPSEILDALRVRVIRELGQTGAYKENKDGMDMSLIRMKFDKSEVTELVWAGANNPLYHIKKLDGLEIEKDIQNNTHYVKLIPPNKQSIGFDYNMVPFVDHKLLLEKGDSIVLFTDGFADQFGGKKGKKFKYKAFKQLLLEMKDKPMGEQKTIIDNRFISRMGDHKQIDDVCVIGLRV